MVNNSENSEANNLDDENTYRKHLSRRNRNLARELSKQKLIAQQYLEERNIFEKKHFASLVLNLKYESMYTKLMGQAKQALTHCVALSANIGQILELLSQGTNLQQRNEEVHLCANRLSQCCKKRSDSPIANKTHAVQPMVSGHVIGRPTINLERISDTGFAGYTNSDPGTSSLDSSLSTDDDERPIDSNSGTATNRNSPPLSQLQQDLNIATRTQPIRGLTAEIIEHQLGLNTDENLEPVVIIEKKHLGRRLESIPEVSESTNSINVQEEQNGALTDHSDMMGQVQESSLSSSSEHSRVKKTNINLTSSSSLSYNPLEGPSTLLDNDGYFTGRRVATKRRVYYNENENSSDESKQKRVNNSKKKVTGKRKILQYDAGDYSPDDQTIPRKKTKDLNRRQMNGEKEPMVVLTKLPDDENVPAIDHETIKSRPRRNKPAGSLKEPNLKGKLRREKY
ncbi:hypothetical protein CBL_13705 [Carabus blaptoides fortunei]